jgi:predicted NAD-dependent protein-ADP-ribosyltransferase YbiA (DUF1768 family)
MEIRSKEKLIKYINHGNKVKYLFFWGRQKPRSGVSKTCFSQWYEASFELDGTQYRKAEHYYDGGKSQRERTFWDLL